jgi:hypothetical protein
MSQENEGADDVYSGEDVIAMGRRTLPLPSGKKVVIGRIEFDDLVEAIGGLPDVSSLAVEMDKSAAATLRRPAARAMLAGMNKIVLKGVIKPELFEKRKDGPTPLDFPITDRAVIYRAILDLSGFNKEAGGQILPLSKTVA